jgi:LysR family glycine cleavage system transcriptional activator
MTRAPLHALQGFVQAAQLRNLSRAAESQHLTVSALSHQIRTLERRLGRTLFERGPRGIALTADGQWLYDRIAPHMEAIEFALRPYVARRDHVLTLSVLPSLSSAWLMPRLPDFVARHPDIELNLQSSIELVDFTRDAGVDAAIRFGKGDWPGVNTQHLFDDWMTPVASPDLLRRLGRIDARDLGRYPLLGDPSGRWVEWFRAFGGNAPKRYVAGFSDSETLQRAAVEGLGIALIRLTLARAQIEGGRLVALSAQRLRADASHWLVFPQRSAQHRGLTVFRDWLTEQASAYASSIQASGNSPPKQSATKPPVAKPRAKYIKR